MTYKNAPVMKPDDESVPLWFIILLILVAVVLSTTPLWAGALWFTESTTPLGVSATFTGSTHDSGATPPAYSYFGCTVNTDHVGTLDVDVSPDGTTWTVAATAAIVASTPLDLTVRLRTRYQRCRLVNGAVAQTILLLASAYTTD